jgi:hypothetical protein
MTSKEFEKRAQQLQRAIGAPDRRRYQHTRKEIREQVCEFAEAARASGLPWQRIADAVALRPKTLHRWRKGARDRRGRAQLLPVAITRTAAPSGGEMALVLANGLRLEGIGVEEALQLLRALG